MGVQYPFTPPTLKCSPHAVLIADRNERPVASRDKEPNTRHSQSLPSVVPVALGPIAVPSLTTVRLALACSSAARPPYSVWRCRAFGGRRVLMNPTTSELSPTTWSP